MMHNFIADVRKGGDLLKSFEQINLVNNMRHFANQLKKGQSPHEQIVCMSYFYNPVY